MTPPPAFEPHTGGGFARTNEVASISPGTASKSAFIATFEKTCQSMANADSNRSGGKKRWSRR